MIKVTVQKNLIGLEDLLVGTGTAEQTRGPTGTAAVTITKINGAVLPYDDTYSMQEKFDALQLQIDTLPEVVDEFGNLLTGLIDTSALDLNLAGRIWRKEIDATHAEIYYGTELMFEYNPSTGNIYIPGGTDYIAADAVVTAAYIAADAVIQGNLDTHIATLGTAALLDVGTAENNIVQLDATGLPAVDGSQLTGIDTGLPIGGIILVPYDTPDTNFLECDGAAISRTTYSALFAKIGEDYGIGDGSTTFNLPDYRGEFIRGWDNGRGIDSGRALGDVQSEELKSHLHDEGTFTTDSQGAHRHSVYGIQNTNGSGYSGARSDVFINDGSQSLVTGPNGTDSQGNHTHSLTGDTGSTGGAETRPRNVSGMYQIKVL